MIERRDWVLLFIGLSGGPHEVDQIRVMKGMFLFTREGPPLVHDLYNFVPYSYGPFDKELYGDLDRLVIDGLVAAEPVFGTNRRVYRPTERGRAVVAKLLEAAPADAVASLRRIKTEVTSKSFLSLLRDVYSRYPEFAVKSVLSK
jgi:DNA-binding PadR family transcriptional regulator